MPASQWFAIESSAPGASAALAVIGVHGQPEAIDTMIAGLGWSPIHAGAVALRATPIAGELVVSRIAPDHTILTPLASRRIVESICESLRTAGFTERAGADPQAIYPEAEDLIDACALDAIARAPSPRAIDAIAAQRAFWRANPPAPFSPSSRALDHLITPPRIVVVGRPNVGKSSACNAMARRVVAIAADEPGTTRDHVGADVDCDGVMVHWIDTPGIPAPGAGAASELDARAIERARDVIARADLLLIAIDPVAGSVELAELPDRRPDVPTVRFGVRSDLGPIDGEVAVRTSAVRGEGFDDLARIVRRTLVPDAVLANPGRWRFHPALPAD